jgi:K+-transporting ATPase KdpF subunit
MMLASAFDNGLGLVLAVAVLAYLVIVLVFPERF